MPKLKSFYMEKEDMHVSSTSAMDNSTIGWVQPQQPFFDGKVAFPSLESLFTDKLKDTGSYMWGKHYYSDDDVSSFFKLERLLVFDCDKLETLIPPSMLNRMQNLETISIRNCKSLRNLFQPSIARDLIQLKSMEVTKCELVTEIIGAGEQEITDGIVFPELTVLQLVNLPKFTSFWCYQTKEDSNYKACLSISKWISFIFL